MAHSKETIRRMLASRKKNAALRAAGELPPTKKKVSVELPLEAIPAKAPTRSYAKQEHNINLIARLILAIAKEMK